MLRIVPWLCREEWLETYHNLYNFDNIEQQTKGLQHVEMWRSRSHSKLPLAIEATASLISAGIEDVRSLITPYVLRHTMAMVIVRFVNGMVDMEQKGAYARSVQSIADEIGIPDWLVDLRHEATHANLPSLEVLRVGFKVALDWLRDHYWESQIKELQERDERLISLLRKYAEHFENNSTSSKKTIRICKQIAQDIADLVQEYNMWELFLDLAFGSKGLLVPTLETLENIFSETTGDKAENISTDLPKDVCEWLMLLLVALNKANKKFLSNIVEFLLKRIHKPDQSSGDVVTHFHACWVFLILNGKQKKWKIKLELDYISLLEVCLNNPSTYGQLFLPLIVDNIEIPAQGLKDKLHRFSTIQGLFEKVKSQSLNDYIQNKDANFELLNKQFPIIGQQIQAKQTVADESIFAWQKCPASFTHSYKFGEFIGNEQHQGEGPDQLHNNVRETETNFEDDNEDLRSEASENDLNTINITEVLNSSEESDAAMTNMKELSDKMTRDISNNIWIF
ncbi:protein LAS1-like [Dendronephthya gigantea]|uniref:protein LAS1-like n=1 Tax=Dendronephthya gigantea TaxID=151771 RepID=UPI001069366C|nr:protein LAS1-like [Dendronephthya gigantea]